jgi:hypothetical protein
MQASVACVCSLRISRCPFPFFSFCRSVLSARCRHRAESSRSRSRSQRRPRVEMRTWLRECRHNSPHHYYPLSCQRHAAQLSQADLCTDSTSHLTARLYTQRQPTVAGKCCVFLFFLSVFAINFPIDTRCTPPTSAMRPPSDEGPDQHLNMPVLLSVEYTSCRLTK